MPCWNHKQGAMLGPSARERGSSRPSGQTRHPARPRLPRTSVGTPTSTTSVPGCSHDCSMQLPDRRRGDDDRRLAERLGHIGEEFARELPSPAGRPRRPSTNQDQPTAMRGDQRRGHRGNASRECRRRPPSLEPDRYSARLADSKSFAGPCRRSDCFRW